MPNKSSFWIAATCLIVVVLVTRACVQGDDDVTIGFERVDKTRKQISANEAKDGTTPKGGSEYEREPEHRSELPEGDKFETLEIRLKAQWVSQLPDVEKVLGLHPEEVDGLLNILIDGDLKVQEAQLSAATPAAEKEIFEARDRRLKEFFGDVRYREWMQYLETTGIRAQIRALEEVISMPLSDDQRSALLDSLVDANRRYQSSSSIGRNEQTNNVARMRRYKEFSKVMHHAAAPYLSAEQLVQYDQLLTEWGPRMKVP